MRNAKRLTPIALLMTSLPALAADIENGAVLAGTHCARCHDISMDGAAKTMPPSFASIAAFRAEDQIRFRILFPQMHSPHARMVADVRDRRGRRPDGLHRIAGPRSDAGLMMSQQSNP